jgi:hypothetical protein
MKAQSPIAVAAVDALASLRGTLLRAVVALRTGLNVDDSIAELDEILEVFDRYPDVIPVEIKDPDSSTW